MFSNWKQAIYYNFDVAPSKGIIDDLVNRLSGLGYSPVALTSDLGPKNMEMFNTLLPNHEPYVIGEHKIFGLADVPHLVKLVRNHFIDHGFLYKGKHLNI